jgi:hypothetical protein
VTNQELKPVLVANPEGRVTFQCEHATPLDLVHAIGRQTRHPIGIVVGRDAKALSRTARRYDVQKVDGWSALQIAVEGTGYSLQPEHGVWELIAGDLTPRQSGVLLLRLTDFRSGPNATMVFLGVQLVMWIGAALHPESGYAGSILGSTNDEVFTIAPIASTTVEELADRIVSMGSKGMWILRLGSDDPSAPGDDAIEIDPYQHYPNCTNSDRTNER